MRTRHRFSRRGRYRVGGMDIRTTTRKAALVAALLAGSGCAQKSALDQFCAQHPGLAPTEPVRTASHYRAPGLRFENWLDWGATMLLDRGYAVVETTRLADHPGDRVISRALSEYDGIIRMSIAKLGDPRCVQSDATLAALDATRRDRFRLELADRGLRADECLAIETPEGLASSHALEINELAPPEDGYAPGLAEWRHHHVFREVEGDRTLAEYWDGGWTKDGQVHTCNRNTDFARFRDELVAPADDADPREAVVELRPPPRFRAVERAPDAGAKQPTASIPRGELDAMRGNDAASTFPRVTLARRTQAGTLVQAPMPDGRWMRMPLDAEVYEWDAAKLFALGGRPALLIARRGEAAMTLELSQFTASFGPAVRWTASVPFTGEAKDRTLLLRDVADEGGRAAFTLVELGDADAESNVAVLSSTRYRW